MDEFESQESSEIIEVPERTFRYWATSRAFIPEEDAVGRQGVRRKYSPKNLVEAAVIRDLAEFRINIPMAAKAILQLQNKDFMKTRFCFLIITAKGEIEVVSEDDVVESERKVAGETFSGRNEAIPISLIKSILEHRKEQCVRGHLDASVFTLLIARRVLERSAVIVPVHRIREEIQQKVASRRKR